MLTYCWAFKGGSGATVIAAGLALTAPDPTLLVDLAGDLPTVLGCPLPAGPGVTDWLAADVPPARLASLELPLAPGLDLLPRGAAEPATGGTRHEALAAHLAADARHVIVDAGTRPPPSALAREATTRLLVVRNCYAGLRAAAAAAGPAPTAIVMVDEAGRRLGADDVEAALVAPVVAVVLHDPAIARAADAGLLLTRLPPGLRRPLRPIASARVAA